MDTQDGSRTPGEPPSPGNSRSSWTTFLLIGLVAYELTSHVWLGITFLCIKFGWEYFRTAYWLMRRDPDRTRGRICFWIYLAAGMWRVAIAGVALMFAYAIVHADNKNQAVPLEFIEALIVAVVGFSLSAGLTLLGMGTALWRKRRVWLDSGVHQSRRLNVWPPRMTGPNYAGGLILTSIFVVAVPLVGLTVGVFAALIPQFGRWNEATLIFASVGSLFVLPFSILFLRDALERRILASESIAYWYTIPVMHENGSPLSE